VNDWQPPRLVIPPSRSDRATQAIQLQTLKLNAELSPGFASTEIDMTFFNPNNQVLEGELQFPLLPGQSIAAFAMDVNGKLRDAVPVEKARGQAIFEDIIRQRIDPGLLEVTQGNNFKLRVYPIPASGVKRVVLRINETLSADSNQWRYRFPIGFADRERIGNVEIDIRATGMSEAPTVDRNPLNERDDRNSLKFSRELLRTQTTWRLRESAKSVRPDGLLDMRWAASAEPITFTERVDGKTYFVTNIAINSLSAARVMSKTIGIIWDSSRSAREADHAKHFALLDRYMQKMRDGEIRLTRIRDTAERVEIFRVRDGDWSQLRTALQKTAYDGATNLGAFMPERSVGEYLLFSDGLSNWGEANFTRPNVPLFTITSSIKNDAAKLAQFADSSGGAFIDLGVDSVELALQKLTTTVTRIHVEGIGANDLMTAGAFARNGRFIVAGTLSSADSDASLQLRLTHPDGRIENKRIEIGRNALSSTGTALRWVTLKLTELDAEYQLHRAEITRLGKRFRIPTRETSLIILDRIEDYVQHEIEPPEELRSEYERLTGFRSQQQRTDRANHLARVLQSLQSKTQWWNHSFPKGPRYDGERGGNKVLGQAVERAEVTGSRISQHVPQRNATADTAPSSQFVPAPPPAPAPAAPTVSASAASGRERRLAESAAPMMLDRADKRSAEPGQFSAAQSTIRLQKWQPDAAYARRMRDAAKDDLYRVYLDEAPSYASSTAFYLDASDIFFERGMTDLGVRVLSNLAEMDLENRHILRILGYRLAQAKQHKLAITVLKRVLALSPNEPQSYRDLGLAYAADGQAQDAVNNLHEVVIRPWHGRFPEIELITLADMNAVIAKTNRGLDLSRIDPRLLKNLPVDLRVVLTWDADNTDIDLWVTDPNGEKAFYGNRTTYQGGRMSQDFTGGYGPEEFSLRFAKPGKYRIEAQYYGDRQQLVTGATTIQARVTKGFGTSRADEQIVTLRLKDRSEVVYVGEIVVK
jgi:Ca-activated chloride channel homolog